MIIDTILIVIGIVMLMLPTFKITDEFILYDYDTLCYSKLYSVYIN